MKIARTLLAFTCLAYTGCSHRVAASVISCPSVQAPPKPILLSASLSNKSKPNEIEKAHVVDILTLTNYSNQLSKLLKNYQL